MRMEVVKNVSFEKWNEILSGSRRRTFFQTHLWAKVLDETYDNYRVATRLFTFDDGLEVLVPCMEIRLDGHGLRRKYESMPLGTYGGLICGGGMVTDLHVKRIIRHFETTCVTSICFNPDPLSDPATGYPSGGAVTPTYTHILPLEKGFDHIWQNEFSSKVRNQVRKAEKSGVEIYVDSSMEGFKRYYAIYTESSKRWGKDKPDYPFKLFEALSRVDHRYVRLWMARAEGEVIAGALNFYYGDNVFYWGGAMLKEYSKYCPNNLLLKTAILDACREGYRYYNFGASGSLEGVRKFKESFGAKRVDYNVYCYSNRSLSHKLYRKSLGIVRSLGRG